jgi:hypothetical protein
MAIYVLGKFLFPLSAPKSIKNPIHNRHALVAVAVGAEKAPHVMEAMATARLRASGAEINFKRNKFLLSAWRANK